MKHTYPVAGGTLVLDFKNNEPSVFTWMKDGHASKDEPTYPQIKHAIVTELATKKPTQRCTVEDTKEGFRVSGLTAEGAFVLSDLLHDLRNRIKAPATKMPWTSEIQPRAIAPTSVRRPDEPNAGRS